MPRKEGPLRTRPQWRCSHERMRAIRPTRRPRVLRNVSVALLAGVPKFRKSVSARGGYFSSPEAIFLGLILVFSKSHFFCHFGFVCFSKSFFFCYFGFLCWGCVCYFWPLFGHFLEERRGGCSGGRGCPKVNSRCFFPLRCCRCFFVSRCVVRMLLVGAPFCPGVVRVLLVGVLCRWCLGVGWVSRFVSVPGASG